MSPIFFDLIDSPIGTLTAAADDSGLRWLLFPRNRHEPARAGWQRDVTPFAELRRQLAAYFAGESQVFNLPLAPQGTNFQQSVWSALRGIPYGQTCSYRDIAQSTKNGTSSATSNSVCAMKIAIAAYIAKEAFLPAITASAMFAMPATPVNTMK